MATIKIRELKDITELEQLRQVEQAVWEMEQIPIHQTFTAMNHGGILIGAFDEEEMVGFLYSFPGFNGEFIYLCSHMLGILPAYRKSGLGMKMKLEQKRLAEQRGFRMITWTFDPLESKNAYLNLHKLGARGAYYKVNHYGDLNDRLNEGLPTDRIEIVWDLHSDHQTATFTLEEEGILLKADDNGFPLITDFFTNELDGRPWFVAVPKDFQTIKKADNLLAKEWRFKTRDVFLTLFEQGFEARDVLATEEENVHYYVFTK